jgi:hypothetical protein
MNNIMIMDYNGFNISFMDKEKVNLTNLFKASKENESKDPRHWLESKPNQEFINTVAKKLNVGISDVLQTQPGRNGGTWAHWQIGLAYAKYLSHELHMFVNQIFKNWVEEVKDPEVALERGLDRATEGYKRQGKSDSWIENRINTKISNKALNKTLEERKIQWSGRATCVSELQSHIFGMKTADKKRALGLTSKATNLRDHLPEEELALIFCGETLAKHQIITNSVEGTDECIEVCSKVGQALANAVKDIYKK